MASRRVEKLNDNYWLFFKTGVKFDDLVDVSTIPTKTQYSVTGRMKKVRADRTINTGTTLVADLCIYFSRHLSDGERPRSCNIFDIR
jgi:hypothetical protein